jgi:hypothetical protein
MAPRMIWDAVALGNHLPFGLQLRGEFEFVKAKPLGSGFDGVSVYEIRGALLRPFFDNRMSLGANFSSPADTRAKRPKQFRHNPACARSSAWSVFH